MFDVGFSEVIVLFVIGLLVLGPERLPQITRKIGHFIGYARRMSRNFQQQLEDELELQEIKDSLPKRVDLSEELGINKIQDEIRELTDESKNMPPLLGEASPAAKESGAAGAAKPSADVEESSEKIAPVKEKSSAAKKPATDDDG